MAISSAECGAVILAGGASRRMGSCKALLEVNGMTMLERTKESLHSFDQILLSSNDPSMSSDLPQVQDQYRGGGPLAGIHAALLRTQKKALFCVPCDLPRFSEEIPRLLMERMPEKAEVFICRDSTGRVHPLCGIYRKSVLPILEWCLMEGRYRVMDFVNRVPYAYLDTGDYVSDEVYFNMNTPLDYRSAIGER